VSDDMGPLANYLTVTLLDEDNKLVSQEFAGIDGGFTLDKFFELDMGKVSTLKVYNGVGLAASYQFMPTATPSGALAILLLGNQPPTANIITYDFPDLAVPNQVRLHANGIDPDGDEVSLRIDWGDNKFTEYGPLQPNGWLFLEEHAYPALTEPASYQVKARARDSRGREGEWTPAQEVVILP